MLELFREIIKQREQMYSTLTDFLRLHQNIIGNDSLAKRKVLLI